MRDHDHSACSGFVPNENSGGPLAGLPGCMVRRLTISQAQRREKSYTSESFRTDRRARSEARIKRKRMLLGLLPDSRLR